MNPAIRSTAEPLPENVRWLFNGLPPLVLRVRREMLLRIGKRVDPALRQASERDLALALTGMLDEVLRRRHAEGESRRNFVDSVNSAASPQAERALLRNHILNTRFGRERRRDLAALDRWLDADTLLERIDARIDAARVEARVLVHMLAPLPLRGEPLGLVTDLLDESDRPTRRLAVTVLSDWLARVHRTGADADGALRTAMKSHRV